ncbi:MAG: hypothetical protein ACRDPA_15490 [Solirubrobacteraceae bacterium]
MLLELAPELDALPPLLALLVLLLLLELLPHAPSPSASTPTAASVPDHALTFIRSSAFAPVAAPRAEARLHRHGQATGVDI